MKIGTLSLILSSDYLETSNSPDIIVGSKSCPKTHSPSAAAETFLIIFYLTCSKLELMNGLRSSQ